MSIKSITIKDVAKVAGVSTATVSRALSNPKSVSSITRESVLKAAHDTGYQVNLAARNLRIQQTGAIVVLVPKLSNPFFSHILAGIEAEAALAGKSVFLVNSQGPEPQNAATLLRYLTTNRADGLIILDGSLPEGLLEEKYTPGISPPVVFCCEWAQTDQFPSVRTNNPKGAVLAIEHLYDLGHEMIGHVTGPMGNVLSQERVKGANKALGGEPCWSFEGDFTMSSGIVAATAFLALGHRPTAVFCASDTMAIGFISELNKNGVSVPDDVSIVGFDDIDIAERFIPALTTIHQPREQIGSNAVKLLVDAMNGTALQEYTQPLVLPVELVVRDSTARLT